MSDDNKEYEEFLKQYEKEHPLKGDTYAQNQEQQSHPAECNVPKATPQFTAEQAIKPAAGKCGRNLLIVISAAVIIIISAALLIVKLRVGKTDVLNGTWNLDGITAYEFDGKGNGALKLPNSSYPFTYKINGDSLSIDFESEAARDITYTFNAQKEKLVLVSIEKNKEITYEFTKENSN